MISQTYGPGQLRIYRFDLPVQTPLILGRGVVINEIPYYLTKLDRGEGWTVSSPLWGGYGDRSLQQGIEDVENLIRDAASYIWKNYVQGKQKGAISLRELQASLRESMDWTDYDNVPSLIRGMAFAPIMGALAHNEAEYRGSSLVDYLREDFRGEQIFNASARPISVAMTLGGADTFSDFTERFQRYGNKAVLKFKIGTKGIYADAEFVTTAVRHAGQTTFYILDNNQAYSASKCAELIEQLRRNSLISRLLFLEQPCKVEEESSAIESLNQLIRQGVRIGMDESVASSNDAARIGQLAHDILPQEYWRNVLVIPKIEKNGLVEFLEIAAAAQRYGLGYSPATLTGPPNQFVVFSQLCASLNCFSVPGTNIVPVEANGYEILKWGEIVSQFSHDPQNSVFDPRNEKVSHIYDSGVGIPRIARTKGLADITLQKKLLLAI